MNDMNAGLLFVTFLLLVFLWWWFKHVGEDGGQL